METDPRKRLAAIATIVVKVGTRVLASAGGGLNRDRVAQLADELHQVQSAGRRVALVSSGAVGAGLSLMGLKERPTDLATLQAVAALGQTKLVEAYDQCFRRHGRHAAQVLLTAGDFEHRGRYLNVRNTMHKLLEMGATPIINENDTVAVEELTFGDNDRLAALVTNLLKAPLLVILSDIAGLYDRDPADPQATVLPTVERVTDAVFALVRDKKTGLSKGGMASKLEAARMVTSGGENMIIASGRQPGALARVLAGETVGTLFLAQEKSHSSWKRWLGFSARPRGQLVLDAGARQAVVDGDRSLLAVGLLDVRGEFDQGDVVSLCTDAGVEIGRGLTNFPAAELRRIKGLKSHLIAQVLGHPAHDEVIHRDNLAVLGRAAT